MYLLLVSIQNEQSKTSPISEVITATNISKHSNPQEMRIHYQAKATSQRTTTENIDPKIQIA